MLVPIRTQLNFTIFYWRSFDNGRHHCMLMCVSPSLTVWGALDHLGLVWLEINAELSIHYMYTKRWDLRCTSAQIWASQFKNWFIHNIAKDDLIIVGHGTSDRNERLHTDGYFWEGFWFVWDWSLFWDRMQSDPCRSFLQICAAKLAADGTWCSV